MDEFVICPACGARIKAGREFCLRCFGPLPTPERPIKPPIWVSLGLSDQNKILVGVGIAAVIAALVGVIVLTEPPKEDETAQAVPGAAAAPRSAAGAQPSGGAEGGAPATSRDEKLEAQRAALEAELERSPKNADALNNLGLVLQQLGQSDDALRRLGDAVAAEPRKFDYRMNLARLASDLSRWDIAIDQYREAARLQPRDYTAQYSLAMALQKKGDDATAIPEFEKARRLGPDAPGVPLGLAASYEKLGRTTDASREYQAYLKLQPNGADADRVRARLAALGGRL
ncbi:MAG TPA: tetratricopeptide repeat protein [Vicinamibacterales bacterium]|nr:tetratricopeptide repeat protein [Vicinamibacterales bacterium]